MTDFALFAAVYSSYMGNKPGGGSLHIFAEDKNSNISDIEFCRDYAKEHEDWLGVYLCEFMLQKGDAFIEEVGIFGPTMACAMLLDRA